MQIFNIIPIFLKQDCFTGPWRCNDQGPLTFPDRCHDVDYAQFTDMAGRDTITGSGAAVKVFATVKDIIQKHKQKTGVPIVIGSKRSEPSRVKLYSRMLDKIAKAKWKTNDEVQWLI